MWNCTPVPKSGAGYPCTFRFDGRRWDNGVDRPMDGEKTIVVEVTVVVVVATRIYASSFI